jgi:hypothetical protein
MFDGFDAFTVMLFYFIFDEFNAMLIYKAACVVVTISWFYL